MDPILRLAHRAERAAVPGHARTPEERLTEAFQTEPAQAYVELLDGYSAILLRMIRRFFQDQDDVMDLYTVVCERLRAQNYRALRHFRAGSALLPWLSVIVANACRDRIRQQRIAALPRHVVSRLDTRTRLVYRHHVVGRMPPEDAAEVISRAGVPCTALDVVESVQHLHSLLRQGARHRLLRHLDPRNAVSLDVLLERGLDTHDSAADIDAALDDAESLARLDAALASFSDEDRLLLLLRFEQDLSAANIAAMVGMESQTRVYTRLRTLLARLRRLLGDADG